MFAYCNNNPVMGCDPCGTCIHNWKFYNCEKCDAFWDGVGDWFVDAYETITSVNQQQALLQTQITMQQNKMVANGAKTMWDAYQRSYELEQESIMLQAQMNIDMFDSPEDIERSIDVIEATLGFSTATYEVGLIIVSPTPVSVKAVAIAVVGVIWGVRGIYRACQ